MMSEKWQRHHYEPIENTDVVNPNQIAEEVINEVNEAPEVISSTTIEDIESDTNNNRTII